MWDLIINPFVTALTAFYALFGQNIVLAIVVLTIIIRMLTYPLLARQQASMKKTQALQPELTKLKEKYKDDREKLSQAQMELYREHGVNPLGGCLPLLIQFPILIGLYQAIFFAIASTPFQLVDLPERLLFSGFDHLIPIESTWLGMDLTNPPTPPLNPVYALALPLLVMGTTWLQSKFSMSTSQQNRNSNDKKDDAPSQTQAMTQSMTTIMPIMFGFFALSFSVGISIYFIVSNAVGIFQYSPFGKRVLARILGREEEEEDILKKPPKKAKPKDQKNNKSGKKTLNAKSSKKAT